MKQMRKTRTKGGGQHAISAKIDQDKWEWLQLEPNKNRIINQGLWLWKYQKKYVKDNNFTELLEKHIKKAGE